MATGNDAFAAGWDDGADDEPLTPTEIERLVILLAPVRCELGEAS